MGEFLQPTVLLPLSLVVIVLGTVGFGVLHKMREKELRCHLDLRVREIEHEQKMKELEIELVKAKAQSSKERAA
jgi:hypothetical protein